MSRRSATTPGAISLAVSRRSFGNRITYLLLSFFDYIRRLRLLAADRIIGGKSNDGLTVFRRGVSMAKRHILIADDDPSIRTLLRTFLEGEGYSISEARTGGEVIGLLSDNRGID